jgi:hypothetical protein
MYAKNNKGEQLYLFIIIDSNNFMDPHVTLKTWNKAMQDLEEYSKEQDDDSWFIKVIKSEINTELHRAKVELLCNHKGWGGDYIRVIEVDSAYCF